VSENGNSPEIHIHPLEQRNGSPERTFSVDGRLGRIISDFDEDLQPSTVVEFLGPDGDEVVARVPINKPFYLGDKVSRACVDDALASLDAGEV
jgi:hypothetical protein